MKNLLFFLLLLPIFTSYSQGFAPFNENNPKRFYFPGNPADNDYFFFSYQTGTSGDTTIFNQYLRYSTSTVDVTGTDCEGWGGSIQPTADTSWLGRRIKYNHLTKELTLLNSSMEPLIFNFGISLGDSSIFYSNGDEYYIRYDLLQQENVIDSLNWVKTYTIWKYDSSGNLSASPLNGFELKLSEQLGLVHFIDCNRFPNLEQGLYLMGQLNPTIGYYQMTYDEAFPWTPGDTIEYKGINYRQSWGMMTTSHVLLTIQDRIETSDSVRIYLTVDQQIDNNTPGAPFTLPPFNIGYPNPIVFKKGANLSIYPHESTFGTISFINDSIDYCGNRKRYRSMEDFSTYCDSCDCFIPIDGNGQYVNTEQYLEGLGQTFAKVQQYGNWVDITQAEMIYSNIGGVQCGNYIPLAVDELSLTTEKTLSKIVDLLGRETSERSNEILIYIYSDGTNQRTLKIE